MNPVNACAPKPSDRRKSPRLPARSIDVLIRPHRSRSSRIEYGKVASLDFNRHGVGFITSRCFGIGDELELLIQSKNGTAEVRGVVCNRARQDQFYRCGIAFRPVSDSAGETLKNLEVFQAQAQLKLFN